MRASRLSAFGKPSEVLDLADVPVPEPGPGEIVLEMLAAPINPADLNVIEGKYGELPALPATIGNEGVGRVVRAHSGVTSVAPGDLVLPMRRGTWAQAMLGRADEVLRLPPAVDVFQAAMLSVNPPTAWAMLHEFVSLREGDWLVQNASNSGVGRSVIQIARACGFRTINVVRRRELFDELAAIGADVVVTEDDDLRQAVAQACGDARPRLGLNAVGGASALNLANALADGGTLVTYGAMGRQPLKIPNGLLIFKNLTFRGIWVTRWLEKLGRDRLQELIGTLAGWCVEGKLTQPVQRVIPLSALGEAVEAAAQPGAGKILLDLQR